MKMFNLLTPAIFISAAFAASTCNHNNCYRALFPTASPSAISIASAFCKSLSSSTATITNFPTRATSACGTSLPPYSSACACLDTALCDASQPSGQPVRNGGFECNLAPWVVDTNKRGNYSVSSPAYTGSNSFGFTTNQTTADNSPPSIQQTVTVTAGQQYNLSFATWFSDRDAGFTGLVLNGKPVLTDDANDGGQCCNLWKPRWTLYTPMSTSLVIRFEFLASTGNRTFRLDSIALKSVTSKKS